MVPRELNSEIEFGNVNEISCGSTHTLLVTGSGQVYSCGNNDHGQLGHDLFRKRPRMFKFRMCNHPISMIFFICIFRKNACRIIIVYFIL